MHITLRSLVNYSPNKLKCIGLYTQNIMALPIKLSFSNLMLYRNGFRFYGWKGPGNVINFI